MQLDPSGGILLTLTRLTEVAVFPIQLLLLQRWVQGNEVRTFKRQLNSNWADLIFANM